MAELTSPENSGISGGQDDASTPKIKRRRLGRKPRGTPGTPKLVFNSILGVPGIEDFMHEVLQSFGGNLSVAKKISTGDVDAGYKTEGEKKRNAFK